MICSTLSGMMAIKHPTLGVLVREDGMVLKLLSKALEYRKAHREELREYARKLREKKKL